MHIWVVIDLGLVFWNSPHRNLTVEGSSMLRVIQRDLPLLHLQVKSYSSQTSEAPAWTLYVMASLRVLRQQSVWVISRYPF